MAKNQVVVSVTSNVKSLTSGLSSATSGLSKFGKVAGVITAAVAAATIAMGVKAVQSASKLEQAMGGMESVFKGSSGQMEKWANAAAGSVGLAKSEYAGLATILGAQLKNMGVSTDALAGKTNQLVTLGADLAAQFGGSTSDAVASLSSLLRGERDPIEKYGVSIKQSTIDAELAAKGLSGLTGEALVNATTIATLEILYRQTADAQGAFARESTTLAGAQQRLSAGLENLSATFGTALLPAATAVTAAIGTLINTVSQSEWFTALTASVTDASNKFADFVFAILNGEKSLSDLNLGDLLVAQFTNLSDWISGGGLASIFAALSATREQFLGAMLKALPGIIDAVVKTVPFVVVALLNFIIEGVNLILGAAPQLLKAALVLFAGLLDAVLISLPIIISAIVAMVPTLLTTAIQLFTALVDAVIVILPILIESIIGLVPALTTALLSMLPQILDAAIQLFTSLVEALPVILPMLVTAIVDLLPMLVKTIFSLIPVILGAAIKLFMVLVKSLPIILPLLLKAVVDLLPVIITTIIGLIPLLLNAAIDLFIALVKAIPKIIPQLLGAIVRLLPIIIGAIIKMIPTLIGAGVNLIGGLIKGLWKAASSLGTALLDIAKDAIKGFLGFLGIHSPSTLFKGFGANLGQGLALGIGKSGKTVSKALDGMSALVSDGFNASMSAPELSLAVRGASASRTPSAAPIYNISVNTLNASAETGQVIMRSIRDYESTGGRL